MAEPAGNFMGVQKPENPYKKLEEAIDYDRRYQVELARPEDLGEVSPFPLMMGTYEKDSRRLVGHLRERLKPRRIMILADVGVGTGVTLQALLNNYPQADEVIGIEESEGMHTVAKFKFNQSQLEQTPRLAEYSDPALRAYWQAFRDWSRQFSGKVKLYNSRLQDFREFSPESIDGVTANQVLHWILPEGKKDPDLGIAFKKFYEMLSPGGVISWSTAGSRLCDDPNYPFTEYGMRYNLVIQTALSEIRKRIPELPQYVPPRPLLNLDSLRAVSEANGFETMHVGTSMPLYDLSEFIDKTGFVPSIVRDLVKKGGLDKKYSADEITAAINESIQATILDERAIGDRKHRYQVVPFFISIKK